MTTQAKVRVSVRKTQIGYKPTLHIFLASGRGYSVRSNFVDRLHRRDAIEDGLARAIELAETNGQNFIKTHRNAGVIAA